MGHPNAELILMMMTKIERCKIGIEIIESMFMIEMGIDI